MTPRETLMARRKELVADLEHIEHDLDETPPKDWEDRASERQGDEVLEALGQTVDRHVCRSRPREPFAPRASDQALQR